MANWTEPITVHVTPEMARKLEEESDKRGLSRSAVARMAIKEKMDEFTDE